MLYFYRRLNLLENNLIEHGKVLQNFIINYNNNILKSQFINLQNMNTTEVCLNNQSNFLVDSDPMIQKMIQKMIHQDDSE